MARTDGLFYIRQTGYVTPVSDASIWIRGTDKYLNFGSVPGASGYGFRDNAGTLEFKNSGGSWAPFGSGGGSQTGIQFQDEGLNLGTSGTVNIVNFTGVGVTASRVGNTVTVNVAGGGGSGTVTSVGVSVPTGLTVSGSPVTTSGTIAIGLDTGRVIPLQSTIDGKVPYTGATGNVDLGAFSLITDKITSKTSAGLTLENNSGGDVLHIGNGGGVNATAYGGWNFDSATANTVAVFGASKTLSSSSVTTTELGYVSGVTSSIQTQLGNRALTGAVTGSGITMSTARILGRTTAGTGAIEEISIGSGLSLSGGILIATGGGGSGETVAWSVNQTAHGFVVGDVVRSNGTANQYTKAQANSATNAEVIGIVTAVADANNFTITSHGRITAGVPTATAGTVFWLSASTAGALTSTQPSGTGEVSLPILTIIQSGTSGFLNLRRGLVIAPSGGGVTDGNKGDITVLGSGTVWSINSGAVSYADIQNVAANTFLANATGSPATVQEISTARIPLFASAITGTPSSTTFLRGDGTWATPSGGGSPGGVSGNVQFNNSGSFGGMSGTTWDDTNRTLAITGATLTASNPIINLSQTWNSGAVDFVGSLISITDTASSARSVPFRVQVGSTPVFDVRKDNTIVLGDNFSGTRFGIQANNGIRAVQVSSGSISNSSFLANDIRVGGGVTSSNFNAYLGATIGLIVHSTGTIAFSNTSSADLRGTQDTILARDAANQLAQRNGTNSQSLRIYKTFTDASNFERLEINGTSTAGWLQIIANSAGTGSANLGIALTPRGTGAISAQVPDSTSTGGNARGNNSVDLQMVRSAATQVASGTQSVVGGGANNTASGNEATVSGGIQNLASGLRAYVGGGSNNQATQTLATVAGGATNVANAAHATVSGGQLNTASGSHSWVPGGFQATTRGLTGAYAYSAGQRAALGDAQVIGQPVRRTTTDATPVSLATNGTPAAATVMVIPANSTLLATAIVTCRDASGNSAAFKAEALFKRDGANNTTRLGFATVTQIGTPDAAVSTANIDLVANDTLEAAEIQVTGVAATTIHWVGELKCVQVL